MNYLNQPTASDNHHTPLQSRRVLVVDDDPIIRDMLVDMLDFEGYSVHTARNGHEALEILRGKDDYLVFLDLLMPVMSGKELCEALEKEPQVRNRHLIVLMSALDAQEEVALLKIDGMLPKPFVVEDVVEMMGEIQ